MESPREANEGRLLTRILGATSGQSIVVELGAGRFNYIQAVRCDRKIGVEIHSPYLDRYDARDVEKVCADMRVYRPPLGACVMLIDSLEHIGKEDGVGLLSRLKDTARKIVVFAPEGEHEQSHDPWDGDNIHQHHLSSWSAQDLEDLGFVVERLNGFHHTNPEGKRDALWAVWP